MENENGNPSLIPRVSVVMTTYDHAQYIAQAIESVVQQKTDFPFEILIGEDCSSDGTREICQRFAERHPDRIRLFLSGHNLGAQENFRRIYDACRGEYIAVCEGDDYWCNQNKLQMQVTALDEHLGWSGCFHTARVVDETPGITDSFLPLTVPPGVVSLEQLASENNIATCSVVYRRKIVPALPEWFRSLALGDWPLNLMYAVHGPFGYIEEDMSVYRRHRGGMWSTLNQVTAMDHSLRAHFAVEAHCEELARTTLIAGRREFLRRCIHLNAQELRRLRRIETRYQSLQLHRFAAIAKWLKSLIGK
jgi:glycosyltransferase involved in cell wall biosynthesis